MAKAKKKETLSLEEKLEQALIPVDEQPYELPDNWCWVKHNSILDISGGSQPAKSHFISEPAEGYTQLYQTRDYGENPVPVYIPDKYATKTTKEGDILLARYGGSLGKVFRAHEGAYNVALAKVIKLYPDLIDDEFLYKYYLAQFYQNFCIKASSGRSAQAGFNREDMDSIPFPLPPLAEQQRIVEQIESLFAKLDEAKSKVQYINEIYDVKEQTYLEQAFSGKLTQKWRVKNGRTLDEWQECALGDIYELKAGKNINAKYIESEQSPSHMYPCFGGNGVRGYVADYNKDGEYPIIGRQGALCGNINIARGKFYATEHAVVVTDKKKNSLSCSSYYLKYLNLNQYATATAQPGLAVGNIIKVSMKYIPYEEQCEISRLLDEFIEKEKDVQLITENVLLEIDLMKKSILAKAFRGELGTNNPDEESAVELLKSILATE